MSRVVLSAGSNMGDRLSHLQSVADELGDRIISASHVYATAPWGGVEQDDFYNVTLIADDPGRDPWDWLRLCHLLEWRADRVRDVRWGPRSLDVDVIACYDPAEVRSRHHDLELPHPRARSRAFVLVPWLQIEPDATLGGTAVRELVAALGPAEIGGVGSTTHSLTLPAR
ncbi:2-amino-4-hydroxy-6-hydroxymethyldihydropteridine diphosphokinase [Tomitella fengzijianii]|uniref:2-amino-4-hydroxy-6-hydroxymethyldihydropteridine diphosphokinase n=1 Tax=Tomitella fengzijianii TaxID=2597660 RepID=A0A516X0A3_9ACTN|nr:2-amino-4-hydroxy-6-hydroxymethyldihydropteridine diphosphokinase [Tomitella fengzijianii]QDQ96488.1 2-amino-4-hydroxy-6-hydroxymethyldihydropteridine diphosphokinase [Tomitella fengzijianii]